MKELENALRRAIDALPALECRGLADALGVDAPRDCDAVFEECEACARRTADALMARMMPEGIEWPRFESGELVQIGDEVLGKHGEPMAVTRVSFVGGGCYFNASHDANGRKRGKGWRYKPGERVKRPEPPDTQERIDADALKWVCEYFGRDGADCREGVECPAYGAKGSCRAAQALDLLRRQRELCARENGGAL